jgi:hypothetical protein
LDEGDREFLGISSAQLAVEAERKKLEQQPRGPYLVRISRTATVREATKTVQETLRKIQLEERDELGTGIKGGSAVGKLESKTGPTSQSPAPHDHPTAKRLYGVFIDDISRVCAELIPSETGEAEELHASSLPRTEPSPASLKNPRPESRGQRRGRVGFTIDGEVESTAAIDSSIGQNSSLDLRLHDSLSCTTTDKTLPVSSQGVGLKKADTTLKCKKQLFKAAVLGKGTFALFSLGTLPVTIPPYGKPLTVASPHYSPTGQPIFFQDTPLSRMLALRTCDPTGHALYHKLPRAVLNPDSVLFEAFPLGTTTFHVALTIDVHNFSERVRDKLLADNSAKEKKLALLASRRDANVQAREAQRQVALLDSLNRCVEHDKELQGNRHRPTDFELFKALLHEERLEEAQRHRQQVLTEREELRESLRMNYVTQRKAFLVASISMEREVVNVAELLEGEERRVRERIYQRCAVDGAKISAAQRCKIRLRQIGTLVEAQRLAQSAFSEWGI